MRLTLRTPAAVLVLCSLFTVWSEDHRNSFTVHPASILFGEYNGTYERAVAPALSLAFTPYYRNAALTPAEAVIQTPGKNWTAGFMVGLLLYLDRESFQGPFTGIHTGIGYISYSAESESYSGAAVRPALTLGYRYTWGRFSLIPQFTASYTTLATLRSGRWSLETPDAPLSGFSSIWGVGAGWTF